MFTGPNVSLYTAKDLNSAPSAQRFIAVTPTPGTGIIGHAAPTTFDETKPYFLLFNGNPVGGLSIFPQCLRLLVTVVSTGGTGGKYTHAMDAGNRLQTAATPLVSACTTMRTGGQTGAIINVGAVVATVATAGRRLLGSCTPRLAVVENAGDEYQFVWGATDGGVTSTLNTSASSQCATSHRLAPVEVPPQTSYLIHQWKAAQSAGPTLEVYFDYLEAAL